jgi:hypothetical protein
MRDQWSNAIPQAMQQHGGVSKDTAERRDRPVKTEKRSAASAPREIDRANEQTHAKLPGEKLAR